MEEVVVGDGNVYLPLFKYICKIQKKFGSNSFSSFTPLHSFQFFIFFYLLNVFVFFEERIPEVKARNRANPCTDGRWGLFPDEDDCTKYWICSPAGSSQGECPQGTYK